MPAFFLYGEPLQASDERLVHVETVAARSRLHDWVIRPHRHRDLHQLLLVRSGRTEATLDGCDYALRAPAALVVPSGVVHAFRFQPNTTGFVLSVSTDLATDLVAASAGLAALLERPAHAELDRAALAATDVWSLTEMLLREFGRSAPERRTALRGLLAALLANFLRLVPAVVAGTGTAASDRELVARFRSQMERRFREHISIAEHADELHTTEARLRRACVAATGRSPVKLLHLRLLIEAERQLRYTSMPITQVAYHLGFDDPAYFTRFFTRQMGVSPRAFRARDGLETS